MNGSALPGSQRNQFNAHKLVSCVLFNWGKWRHADRRILRREFVRRCSSQTTFSHRLFGLPSAASSQLAEFFAERGHVAHPVRRLLLRLSYLIQILAGYPSKYIYASNYASGVRSGLRARTSHAVLIWKLFDRNKDARRKFPLTASDRFCGDGRVNCGRTYSAQETNMPDRPEPKQPLARRRLCNRQIQKAR